MNAMVALIFVLAAVSSATVFSGSSPKAVFYSDSETAVVLKYHEGINKDYSSNADIGNVVTDATLQVKYHENLRNFTARSLEIPIRVVRFGPVGDCGSDQILSRRGKYLVLTYIVVIKGCQPVPVLVDLETGAIVQIADETPNASLRRSDGSVFRVFARYRVSRVDIISLNTDRGDERIEILRGAPRASSLVAIRIAKGAITAKRGAIVNYGGYCYGHGCSRVVIIANSRG